MLAKKGRITVTTLSDMGASFYEQADRKGNFHTIAMMPLGWGTQGCQDTEADYYQSVAFFINTAREERSSVFILGYGPRMIPSVWIKAAELITQHSEVTTVLIPLCKAVEQDSENQLVHGTILFVDEHGLFKTEVLGEIYTRAFWTAVANTAMSLSYQGFLTSI